MRISWGILIIISFVIFAAGIVTMVAISFSSSTDLVSENYYEQEIKYQDQIDILTNSVSLDKNVSVESEGSDVILRISNAGYVKDMKGYIYFYRSSDAGRDFKIDFRPDADGVQKISSGNLYRGSWKVKLSLNDGSKDFFVEKNIFID